MADEKNNPLTMLAIGFAIFTLIVTVIFFGWWAMKDHFMFGHDRFDQVRWMTPASQDKPCDRGDMVLDLQQHLLKPGMTKRDVAMLLGRPAWEDAAETEYELGVCQWVVHGLRLYFDADERLLHTAIVQH
jgi:hypothetical protein